MSKKMWALLAALGIIALIFGLAWYLTPGFDISHVVSTDLGPVAKTLGQFVGDALTGLQSAAAYR